MVTIMKWLIFGAILWVLLAWYANRSIFIPMPHPGGDWQAQQRLGAEDVRLESLDHVLLHGWWLESPGSPLVTLMFHGNAGNVTHREATLRTLKGLGSSVLLMDYRGYGRSRGRPTESRIYEDATVAYQAVLTKNYKPAQIVLFGESLGTAVAVELASRVPCGGLVLEAPFPSIRAVAQTVVPGLGPLVAWGFDTRSRIGRVNAPVLVVHGDRDDIIPPRLGRQVFDAANQPKRFYAIPNASHNDILEAGGTAYVEVLREFYASLRR